VPAQVAQGLHEAKDAVAMGAAPVFAEMPAQLKSAGSSICSVTLANSHSEEIFPPYRAGHGAPRAPPRAR
jgi:hypothetical protein